MLCLDITVNGKQYCVAGVEDVEMLGACITYRGPGHIADRDKPRLSVNGCSSDFASDFHWGKQECFLTIGDMVIIRVVEASAPDAPIRSPSALADARIRNALFEDTFWRRHAILQGLLVWVVFFIIVSVVCRLEMYLG